MCHESEVSVGMPTSLVGSAAWDRGYKTPKRKICTINRQLNVLHASAGVPSNPVSLVLLPPYQTHTHAHTHTHTHTH